MDTLINSTLQAILNGDAITRSTAQDLSHNASQELYQAADTLRRHFVGNHFDLCSIINAKSGNCTENCRFCAQSARHHTGVSTYKAIDEKEAMDMARDNEKHGVHRISLVTSGRSLDKQTITELTQLYQAMGQETRMTFCASAGFLTKDITQALLQAGVVRYHCNLEASRKFFPQVCTTHTWAEKVETLKLAHEMGMSLCSGGIIGMGETMDDRLDMAFELRELGVKSIPINILTPIPGTPLAKLPPLSLDEVLTTIALFRFINPDAVIRMAGGRQQLGKEQYRCFSAGANGAIVGNYLTTTGGGINDDLKQLSAMGYSFTRSEL